MIRPSAHRFNTPARTTGTIRLPKSSFRNITLLPLPLSQLEHEWVAALAFRHHHVVVVASLLLLPTVFRQMLLLLFVGGL